jgi:hypothetical protein
VRIDTGFVEVNGTRLHYRIAGLGSSAGTDSRLHPRYAVAHLEHYSGRDTLRAQRRLYQGKSA